MNKNPYEKDKTCNNDYNVECFDRDSETTKSKIIMEEYEKLSSDVIFEIIRHDGEKELSRKAIPLFFSALAAGLMISFSFYFRAILHYHAGHTLWTDAISGIGYTTGFLIVILGRLQLFTENTITTVIPFYQNPTLENLGKTGKLWAIVLLSNLVGTFIAALFMASPNFVSPEIANALSEVAHHIMVPSAYENILRGIPAGMLIAAIVWMMPMSSGFSFFTIFMFTYFIAIGGFAHVVVGSGEAAYAVIVGHNTVYDYFFRFLIPAAVGNIIGGTGVFTLLVSAQVKSEK